MFKIFRMFKIFKIKSIFPRSGSSGSSTGASETAGRAPKSLEAKKANKSFNSSLSDLSIESLDNTGQEEEDLLADCISSAMPKSKSEHFDLSGKLKSRSKKRHQKRLMELEARRASSPGVDDEEDMEEEPMAHLKKKLLQFRD